MPSIESIISMLETNLFDALGEAVVLIDKEYNVLYANTCFKESFSDRSPGLKCYNLIGKDSPCQICTCSISSKKQLVQEKEEKIKDNYYLVSSKIIPGKIFSNSFYIETYKDITYSKNLEESLKSKNEILKNNLDIARQVQQSLLPQPISTDKIKITYRYYPCEELGGDFFNLYQIDKNTYGIFMADVSGHGVSAAMLTMFLNSSYSKTSRSPAYILDELFKEFNVNNFLKSQYIAIFYAIINIDERQLVYCNAGLNSFPILFDPKSGKTQMIESSGFPISNWVENPEYADNTISIGPNEKVLFYTDGIAEAKNRQGKPYGAEHIICSLTEGNPSTKITLDRIISYLEDFADHPISKAKDDVSLLILELP